MQSLDGRVNCDMIAPGIDGRSGEPALFDGIEDNPHYLPSQLIFQEVSTFSNGVIWARYLTKHA